MNVVEHFFIGWCVANASPALTRRERTLITAAAVMPDLDGIGMIVEIPTRDTADPLLWWTDYHHVLFHNVTAAVAVTVIAYLVARQTRLLTAGLTFVSFNTHIIGDIVGARGPDGYQWPIPYFMPFSRTPELAWAGQWALNAWQNFVITGLALAITLYLSWARGYSPLEMFSRRANNAFVEAIRDRFQPPGETARD